MLNVHKLSKAFGGIQAVSDLDFQVYRDEILGLIGPNGAGKTTVFALLTGFHKPTYGKILFEGRDVTGLRPNKVAAAGLVRTFQLVNLVGKHTVMDNLMTAYHLQRRAGVICSVFRTSFSRQDEDRIFSKAMNLLLDLGLDGYRGELVYTLPHGLQKALGIALALATEPKMLLLDEPTAGMSAAERAHVMEIIRKTRDRGVTIMLVEHDLKVVMGTCDRILVLNFGRKIAEGKPQDVANNQEVISAYLGYEKAKRNDH